MSQMPNLKSGIAIVDLYEKKFRDNLQPIRRAYLIELIDCGMQQAYEAAKQEVLRLAKGKINSDKL